MPGFLSVCAHMCMLGMCERLFACVKRCVFLVGSVKCALSGHTNLWLWPLSSFGMCPLETFHWSNLSLNPPPNVLQPCCKSKKEKDMEICYKLHVHSSLNHVQKSKWWSSKLLVHRYCSGNLEHRTFRFSLAFHQLPNPVISNMKSKFRAGD